MMIFEQWMVEKVCQVCTESKLVNDMVELNCCIQQICEECIQRYCTEKVRGGIFTIECPFTPCKEKLDHGMIVNNLDENNRKLFKQFIAESRRDPCVKSCPSCSKLERISEQELKAMESEKKSWFFSKSSNKSKISCLDCDLNWCFLCHAPWHEGISCSTYLKGDQAFAKWMSWKSGSEFNAHFCPKCRVPIQRSTGCRNMTCTQCSILWCYDCGGSIVRSDSIFGPHHSKTALKGCLAPRNLFFNSIPITYFCRIYLLIFTLLYAILMKKTVICILRMPIFIVGLFKFHVTRLSGISFAIVMMIAVYPFRYFLDQHAASRCVKNC